VSPSDPRPQDDDLAQLLAALERPLARTLVRFRIPAQDAEDLLQETMLLFLTKRPEIRDPGAWISTTLRHRCVIYWRRRRRSLVQTFDDVLLESLGASEDAHPARCQLTTDLSKAIARLPERCRNVLRLRYALDCDGPEIAARLGYQDSSIRQVTHRCLSALSVQMLSGGYRSEVSA
jgi:RNA polymerase sigma factor (sigma-70 family)